MKVNNPHELVGKEVVDVNGNTVGTIDKTWNSWNQDYPGYFFGIKTYDNTRDTWFRGTCKLIPIYSDYIKHTDDRVFLNKTTEELGRFWNKAVHFGNWTCATDELVEKPVYDRNHSKVGTFYSWTESDGTYKNYGVLLDPYLCGAWKMPYNTLWPIPPNFLTNVTDTIQLDKTLDELKGFWDQQQNTQQQQYNQSTQQQQYNQSTQQPQYNQNTF